MPDQYDPKTDEKVDQIERGVHGDLSDERETLKSLEEAEKELEVKLRELQARKAKIIHPEE